MALKVSATDVLLSHISPCQVAVERLLKMKALSLPGSTEGRIAGMSGAGGRIRGRESSPGLSPPPEPQSEPSLGIASHLQAGGAGLPWEEWTPVPLPAMYCELYSFFGDSLAVRFSAGPSVGGGLPVTSLQPPGPRQDPPGSGSAGSGGTASLDTTRKMPQLTASLSISPRQDGSPNGEPAPPSLPAPGR